MKLRTAIIGMGKMGRIRMRMLTDHPGFEVVALCDLNANVASEFPGMFFTTAWQEIFSRELDAVFICTFNDVMSEIVCQAFLQKIHIFCEKPPGRSVADVEQMMAAEKEAKGVVLKFGFNHRFHYAIMEAKSIIDSGRFGQILWARGIYGKAGGLFFEKDWRADKNLAGGGILLDQGIHMLDLMLFFLGDMVEVKSCVENSYWKGVNLEDNAFALMKTADNKVAMVHSSATQWKHKFSLDIFFDNGYVSLNGILTSTRSYGDESITFAKKQFEDEAKAFGRPREETIYFDKDDSWKLEVAEFYECVTEQKQSYMGSSQDALRVMELLQKVYDAAKPN